MNEKSMIPDGNTMHTRSRVYRTRVESAKSKKFENSYFCEPNESFVADMQKDHDMFVSKMAQIKEKEKQKRKDKDEELKQKRLKEIEEHSQ